MPLRCAIGAHRFAAMVSIGESLHVRCSECGQLSSGVPLNTWRVRVLWSWDRFWRELIKLQDKRRALSEAGTSAGDDR